MDHVPLYEAKDYPPVGFYDNAPEAPPIAFQGMQPETGQVHVGRDSGAIQNREDILELFNLVMPDAPRFVPLEKPFQALVPETLDHTGTLSCKETIVNLLQRARYNPTTFQVVSFSLQLP